MIWGSGVELSNFDDMYEQMTSSEEKKRDVINIWLNKLKKVHSINKTNKAKEKWKDRWILLTETSEIYSYSINFSFFQISHLLLKFSLFEDEQQ